MQLNWLNIMTVTSDTLTKSSCPSGNQNDLPAMGIGVATCAINTSGRGRSTQLFPHCLPEAMEVLQPFDQCNADVALLYTLAWDSQCRLYQGGKPTLLASFSVQYVRQYKTKRLSLK